MNVQEILERFAIISNLSCEELAPWIPLCEEACNEIKANLKDGISEEENSRRLNVAAAALAFYRYVMYRASGAGMQSFSAGELKIRTDAQTSVKMAYNVWRDARSAVSDLLKDEDFAFERIV